MLMALVRGLPGAAAADGRRGAGPLLPFPRRVMVLGLGEIGRELATLLRRNGISVVGVARERTPQRDAACDTFAGADEWRRKLAECDACVLCLPGTRSTRQLFDSSAMDALPRGALVINVGRGSTLDTEALLERLGSGQLGGAALDVVEPDPSPDDSRWRNPRLLVTPKVASLFPGRQTALERFVEEQVSRYLGGEALKYPVNLDRALD
jgi:phosphoglycerate dehydrogenase-like enzyme